MSRQAVTVGYEHHISYYCSRYSNSYATVEFWYCSRHSNSYATLRALQTLHSNKPSHCSKTTANYVALSLADV